MGPTSGRPARWTLLLSLGLLVVGAAGYFALERGTWTFYALAHVGALGAIGLLATSAAVLAKVKRRDYWRAFSLTTALSIISGALAVLVFLLGEDGALYCGGSVCLGVAIVMIAVYSLLPRRTTA
jgi:hypothetical protein